MKIKEIAEIQIGYQSRGKVEPNPKGSHQLIQIKDIDDESWLSVEDLFRITPEGTVDRYLVDQGRCSVPIQRQAQHGNAYQGTIDGHYRLQLFLYFET